MSYKIICPYCFKEMQDDQVMFRSELVHHGEPDILPDDYDDLEDFKARYRGPDKEDILRTYQDWAFFAEVKDPAYEAFWENFNGTTEYNPADDLLKVKAYHRRVIDPANTYHQKFLKRQADDSFFLRDTQGMVSQVELITGEKCNRRVCRHCHNPLPDSYGKNPVRFVTVIGITGAGKTVYLSQLLKNMKNYAVKVGLTARKRAAGVQTFLENNYIAAGTPLPGSTPATRLQQPLFYSIERDLGNQRKSTETFVLYDVAGEVFKDGTADLVYKFAPFIEHADGAIVLIDPMQFEVISGAAKAGRQLDDPTTALNTIQDIVTHGNNAEKCRIPFAICISKADTEEVQSVLADDLRGMLLEDVRGVEGANGFYQPIFNAKDYGHIGKELSTFIKRNDLALAQMLQTNYASYSYFAVTALGSDVKDGCPVGPVLPKRVEEPVYWLFYKLGYIDKNGPLPGEIKCPNCGNEDSVEIPEDERWITERRGLFRKTKRYVNRRCKSCGNEWEFVAEI